MPARIGDRQHRLQCCWTLVALLSAGLVLLLVFLLAPQDLKNGISRFAESVAAATTRTRAEHEDIEAYIRMNGIQHGISPGKGLAGGPLRVNPANRRYFMDGSGRTIYLAGSHTWLNLQDGVESDPPPKFDYSTWLSFLQSQDHNFFRLWAWEQAKWSVEKSSLCFFDSLPYQRTERKGELALDGKAKFDLTKFNQAYFDRLRQRVMEAGRKGIYVSIMLFNGWSVAYPKGSVAENNPWRGHPFNAKNNINGIDGDLDGDNSGVEVHELSNPKITVLQQAYVRKVIDSVNDLDNVLFEISNESHNGSLLWQYHMIDYIHNYEAGKPKQHPVGMTALWPNGDNTALYASNADWISPNGNLHDRPSADGRKVVVADTDHLCGICGDRKWVWMSFTRGENPLFMDQYDDGFQLESRGYRLTNSNDVSLRKNLGYTRQYADRMNMKTMVPRGELATSGHVLADLTPGRAQYLVYLPEGGNVEVDLSGAARMLNVEWFNPATGVKMPSGTTVGGGGRSFTAPFDGDAVLYIQQEPNGK